MEKTAETCGKLNFLGKKFCLEHYGGILFDFSIFRSMTLQMDFVSRMEPMGITSCIPAPRMGIGPTTTSSARAASKIWRLSSKLSWISWAGNEIVSSVSPFSVNFYQSLRFFHGSRTIQGAKAKEQKPKNKSKRHKNEECHWRTFWPLIRAMPLENILAPHKNTPFIYILLINNRGCFNFWVVFPTSFIRQIGMFNTGDFLEILKGDISGHKVSAEEENPRSEKFQR